MQLPKLSSTIALLLMTSATFADEYQWNSASISHSSMEFDEDSEFSMTGVAVAGSYAINENVFVNGQYRKVSDAISERHGDIKLAVDLSLEMVSIGGGLKYPVADTFELYLKGSYKEFKAASSFNINGGGISESESSSELNTGIEVGVGVTKVFTQAFQVNAAVSQLDIDDQKAEIVYDLSGSYQFYNNFGVVVSYSKFEDFALTDFGVTYQF